MKISIKTKLIAMVSMLILISAGFFGWFSINHEKNSLKAALNERISSLSDNLARNSEYSVLISNKEELEKLAKFVLIQPDIIYVQIADRKGSVLTRVDKNKDAFEANEEYVSFITSEQRTMAERGEDIILGVESSIKREQIGTITIGVSLKSLKKKADELKIMVVLVVLAILIFVVFGVYFATNRFINNPIVKLIAAMDKIAGGDLNYKVDIKTRDEMGVLSDFFNNMTSDLKISKEKIEDYNKNLEKKVEERTTQLESARTKLIQSEKMVAVGQLAGGVAHEINNPLTVILGYAQTILKSVKEEDPLYKPLKSIEIASVRCKKIVSDLLAFSRTEKLNKEDVNICDAIDQAITLVQAWSKVKDVKVVKNYEQVPHISTNKNQIQQVIVNLCNNAVDAMPEGGTITIAVKQFEKFIEISIADTGQGMSDEVKHHIFEPFFTTKDVGKGTGLGLSLCHGIIAKNNGTIEINSEIGKGTNIIIKLPVTAAAL